MVVSHHVLPGNGTQGTLVEQSVLLTSEPNLQPQIFIIYKCNSSDTLLLLAGSPYVALSGLELTEIHLHLEVY